MTIIIVSTFSYRKMTSKLNHGRLLWIPQTTTVARLRQCRNESQYASREASGWWIWKTNRSKAHILGTKFNQYQLLYRYCFAYDSQPLHRRSTTACSNYALLTSQTGVAIEDCSLGDLGGQFDSEMSIMRTHIAKTTQTSCSALTRMFSWIN